MIFGYDFGYKDSEIVFYSINLGKNARKILENLRETSEYIQPFDLEKRVNLLENVKFTDLGIINLKKLKEVENLVKNIVKDGKIPFGLNFCHLPAFFSVKACKPDTLIIFDAHADCYSSYDFRKLEDEKIYKLNFSRKIKVTKFLNDATWLRRLLEKTKIKTFILGLRSCCEEEFLFLKKKGICYSKTCKLKGRRVYISVDMDVFDPSIANTLHPEPAGLTFDSFKKIISSIRGNIVGCDVCCFLDDEKTLFLTSAVILQLIYKIRSKKGK